MKSNKRTRQRINRQQRRRSLQRSANENTGGKKDEQSWLDPLADQAVSKAIEAVIDVVGDVLDG